MEQQGRASTGSQGEQTQCGTVASAVPVLPSTAELAGFFALASDLLCTVDTSDAFVALNPAWQALLGWSPEELRGRSFHELVHPDDRQKGWEALGVLRSERRIVSFEGRVSSKHGGMRRVHWRIGRTEGDGWQGVGRDVTDRRHIERELVTCLATVPDLLARVSPEGVVQWVNDGSLGTAGGLAVGSLLMEAYPPRLRSFVAQCLRRACASAQLTECITLGGAGGALYSCFSPLARDVRAGAAIVLQRRLAQVPELDPAGAMRVLERVAGRVVQAVQTSVSALADQGAERTPAQLQASVNAASALLGEFTALLAGDGGETHAGPVVKSLVPLLETVSGCHQVRLRVAEGVPPVALAAGRLRQLVTQAALLLRELAGEVGDGPLDAQLLCAAAEPCGGGAPELTALRLACSPGGPGQTRLVEYLERECWTHLAALAQDCSCELRLVTGGGGPVSIEFGLPVAEAAPGAVRSRPAVPVEFAGTETILLTEDENVARTGMARYLTSLGYRVVECADGQEALHTIEQSGGTFDALVVDLVMPRMGGLELAERVWASYPALKILFTSGFRGNGLVNADSLDCRQRFLQKPFRLEELARVLRQLLATSTSPGRAWQASEARGASR